MPETGPLLPGEDPESELVDDAAHWVNVYVELSRDLERMLASLGQGDDSVDRRALLAQLDHLVARAGYWRQRWRRLGGGESSR